MSKIEKLRELNATVSKIISRMETHIFIESVDNVVALEKNAIKEIKTKTPVSKKQ